MATHSSTSAWRISWTEEPGGLWSIRSQRIRRHWSDLAHTHYAMFRFLRNLHTILDSDCTNLHSHHHCGRVTFLPHPLQYLLFVDFLMMDILISMRWYIIVVFDFHFSNNKWCWTSFHLFVGHPYVLERCLFRSCAHFFTELVGSLFVLLSCMSCLYILEINPLSVSFANIFFILRVSFCFVYGFLCCAKALKFN